MSTLTLSPVSHLTGTIRVPGDKSISHRAVMLGALAHGTTEIRRPLVADDTRRTIDAFRALGVQIQEEGESLRVQGQGLQGLKPPAGVLDLGNSGTTMRLLMGILAGQSFECQLTGDVSLSQRPMRRVSEPLREMGATVTGRDDANFAPITMRGGGLRPIQYTLPIPSAQVKSAVLLAGLYPAGTTEVIEPVQTRDHTERMLAQFGATFEKHGMLRQITGPAKLQAQSLTVPGDISAAAFFVVAATLVPQSELVIEDVGLNPTRTKYLEVLQAMGAEIERVDQQDEAEPRGALRVRQARLHGLVITEEVAPLVIDELPILMVAATQAEGTTRIEQASELRVKETDRIHSMVTNLSRLGADIRAEGDTVIIHGPTPLKGAAIETFDDHRTAMSCAIAALLARGPSTLDRPECVKISCPEFFNRLRTISQ